MTTSRDEIVTIDDIRTFIPSYDKAPDSDILEGTGDIIIINDDQNDDQIKKFSLYEILKGPEKLFGRKFCSRFHFIEHRFKFSL